jgi:hypothetical protein
MGDDDAGNEVEALAQEPGRVRGASAQEDVEGESREDLELRRIEEDGYVEVEDASEATHIWVENKPSGVPRAHKDKEPELLKLLRDAVGAKEASLTLGIPLRTVHKRQAEWVDAGLLEDVSNELRRYGARRLTRQQENKIRRRLELGWARQAIAAEIGCGVAAVNSRAEKWGFAVTKRPKLAGEDSPFPDPIPYDELSVVAKRGLGSFKFFRAHYLKLRFDPWGDQLAEELLAAWESREEEWVVVNAPPGIGKSTLITYAFVVWVTVRERAKGRWLTVSLGHREEGKAKWYVTRIRNLLSTNRQLQMDYGFFSPREGSRRWSSTELDVAPLSWEDVVDKEPTITAGSYLGATLSGRYNIVVWDDLIDQQNSATLEQRRKLARWNDVEAETRMEPGGLYVLSNARYGPEDLSHECLRATDPDEVDADGRPKKLYHHIAYSAHYDELCDGKTHTGPWPSGCLLSPDRISWKKLSHHRAKDDSRFELVWLNHDSDPAGSLANPLWFTGGVEKSSGITFPGCFDEELRFGARPEVLEKDNPDVSVCTVDPGPSRHWAIEHWLVHRNLQFLFQGERPIMPAPGLLYRENDGKYTGKLEEFWQVGYAKGLAFTYLIVEINTAQKWLLQYPFVAEWALARGVTIVRHTTSVNRADPDKGVEMVGPLYKRGEVRLPYGGHDEQLFSDQFRREACAWPEGSSDDLVMAHWFLNAKLPVLVTANIASFEEEDLSLPAFVRRGGAGTAVPAFARIG